MRRVVLALGVALAAAALVWLFAGGRGGRGHGGSGPPLDQIDAASRARLERVLREADRQEARRP